MMNKIILLILSLILVGCEKKEPVDKDDLIQRNGVWYEKFSNKPFTGEARNWGKFSGNYYVSLYKNGNRDGRWLVYYDNGKLRFMNDYKDGIRDGLSESYDTNGLTILRKCYQNDEEVDMSFCEGQ